jgi:3,4-dihydroxyphenylacetate 2,3-dioxygenase
MGEISIAAKVTHVPSMYISELPGPHQGCRDSAIAGHKELSKRARALGVDTLLVLDTHWLVNGGYHINCCEQFDGVYTSNELPHFIQNLEYHYSGNPALGHLIAECANEMGVNTRAHEVASLSLEYGTLVPCRYMNEDSYFNVVSMAGWCAQHSHADSMVVGRAIKQAIEKSDSKVMVLASGSLSHRFQDNGTPEEGMFKISDEFFRQVDLRVLELWQQGCWQEFTDMLGTYNATCHGEGGMHDTVMLMSMLGWNKYQGKAEIISEYFASSGTGQVNVLFPVDGIV